MDRPRRPALLSRFLRAERGATAVEFALISIPLMVMVVGILELSMVMLATSTLQTATEVARQIRTGQFQQTPGASATSFETLVCNNMSWLQSNCAANLYVQAQVFSSYQTMASANLPPPADPGAPGAPAQPFAVGGPCDIVLVRTFYRWEVITPLMDRFLEDSAGSGERLISAVTAFRNEPWDVNPTASMPC